jgi:hypothetical protein
MRLFLEKPHLFANALCRQRDVLSWKMIARHHAKVHPTGGSLRVFRRFSWLEVGSGKVALSRPAHQRVTQIVGRFETKPI